MGLHPPVWWEIKSQPLMGYALYLDESWYPKPGRGRVLGPRCFHLHIALCLHSGPLESEPGLPPPSPHALGQVIEMLFLSHCPLPTAPSPIHSHPRCCPSVRPLASLLSSCLGGNFSPQASGFSCSLSALISMPPLL